MLKSLFSPPLRLIFGRIYRKNLWGSAESVSGGGSTLERTEAIRAELPRLLRKLEVRSLLDAPCGDFNWMRKVDLDGIHYIGIDIVPAIIRRNRQLYGSPSISFAAADITRGPIPEADVILCRDALDHLSLADAKRAISIFRDSGSKYLLATTHTSGSNDDIQSGHWRPLDLTKAPFVFPPPLEAIVENRERAKLLGLWRLSDL